MEYFLNLEWFGNGIIVRVSPLSEASRSAATPAAIAVIFSLVFPQANNTSNCVRLVD
jgi:hypothetical protein